MNKFEEFGLSKELLNSIKKLGFTSPTDIQSRSLPSIMKGLDVIGESATGSGKTLAFGAGIIEKVNPNGFLQALVLTPTRELAEQVKNEIIKLSYKKSLKIITIYGGVSINPQIRDLTKAHIVVGTPGRILDHLERRTINLSKIRILVLDEADRMLDMGFIEDVEKIIKQCPNHRQTLFFSATISSIIKRLANKYMKQPITVATKNQVDPSKLKQVYYDIQKNKKLSLLVYLIKEEKSGLVLIFCNTRRTVDFVTQNLKSNGINAIPIHGGLSQEKRNKTLKTFNTGQVEVLVCTDVAARGLHIDNVSHVYNYEIPKDSKDYVHRIGRTARAGESGKAINFLSEHDHDNFSRLLRDYSEFYIQKIKTPLYKRVKAAKVEERKFSRNGFKKSSRSNHNRKRY